MLGHLLGDQASDLLERLLRSCACEPRARPLKGVDPQNMRTECPRDRHAAKQEVSSVHERRVVAGGELHTDGRTRLATGRSE
jgi:hypothetical protein